MTEGWSRSAHFLLDFEQNHQCDGSPGQSLLRLRRLPAFTPFQRIKAQRDADELALRVGGQSDGSTPSLG